MSGFSPFSTAPSARPHGTGRGFGVNGGIGTLGGGSQLRGIPTYTAGAAHGGRGAGTHPSIGGGARGPPLSSPLISSPSMALGSSAHGAMGMGISGLEGPSAQPSLSTFSTSATTNLQSNAAMHGNAGRHGFLQIFSHIDDLPADADPKKLTKLQEFINSLASKAPKLSKWESILSQELTDVAADMIEEELKRLNAAERVTFLATISDDIISSDHADVISQLAEPAQSEIRDRVLKRLLDDLINEGKHSMSSCVSVLASMASNGLVRLSGIAATVDQLLRDPANRRAGFALLGCVAQSKPNCAELLTELASKNIEDILVSLYADPEYEADVVGITQVLREKSPIIRLTHVLHKTDAPPSSMQFCNAQNELISTHMNGDIQIWSCPTYMPSFFSTDCISSAKTLTLPAGYIPTSIDHEKRTETFCAVAAMTLGDVYPYKAFKRNPADAFPAGAAVDAHSARFDSAIFILARNADSELWQQKSCIPRPPSTFLTSLAILPNSLVAAAESPMYKASFLNPKHRISLLDVEGFNAVREIPEPHQDHVTALATCTSMPDLLLSGSRDTAVKAWDVRASNYHPILVSDQGSDTRTHTDTISAICTSNLAVVSASMDGSMALWDCRSMREPVIRRVFNSPVLSLSLAGDICVAVGTVNGIFLVPLDSLGAIDVFPNYAATALCRSADGSTIFSITNDPRIGVIRLDRC